MGWRCGTRLTAVYPVADWICDPWLSSQSGIVSGFRVVRTITRRRQRLAGRDRVHGSDRLLSGLTFTVDDGAAIDLIYHVGMFPVLIVTALMRGGGAGAPALRGGRRG